MPKTYTEKHHPQELVLRVNEVYHDVEGRLYEEVHPEIFVDEKERWEQLGESIGMRQEALTILDIGTGTGFVPLTIGRFLKETDTVICSDISAGMLSICEENLARYDFKCSFRYLKVNGKTIPLDHQVDYILLNSVLHHIPDMESFFLEADRVLKVHGHIVLAHEPNESFYSHTFLWNNYRLLSVFATPKRFVASVLRKTGLMEPARKFYSVLTKKGELQSEVMREVNAILIREGAIETPLTSAQMTELVDIHSPTAGGYHKGRGIDMNGILRDYMSNFSVVRLDTYNYLNMPSRNYVARSYAAFLEKSYPGKGATILAVLEKDHERSR
jgi:ubiquinone/menaquinone biosynthesis C-methylase UbiE